MKAKRYNSGKLRFGLIPTEALEELALVYTKGAHKYTIYEDESGKKYDGKDISLEDSKTLKIVEDGANNWRLGQNWKSSIESVKRHIHAWENGEDIDEELGTKHLANAAWGLFSILTYYKIFPQGDDRDQWYKKPFKKLWLDLDGVCVEFEKHFLEYFNLPTYQVVDWADYRFVQNMEKVKDNDEFWLSCPPLFAAQDLKYPVEGYCTARNCSNKIIHKWLEKNNFPKAKIINVGLGGNKVEALKDCCDVMFDDSIKNFVDLQSNGIACYLMTRDHNRKYDVGHWRCNDINEFVNKIL